MFTNVACLSICCAILFSFEDAPKTFVDVFQKLSHPSLCQLMLHVSSLQTFPHVQSSIGNSYTFVISWQMNLWSQVICYEISNSVSLGRSTCRSISEDAAQLQHRSRLLDPMTSPPPLLIRRHSSLPGDEPILPTTHVPPRNWYVSKRCRRSKIIFTSNKELLLIFTFSHFLICKVHIFSASTLIWSVGSILWKSFLIHLYYYYLCLLCLI